ncbi:MAG TPA: histidine ammonia-lyase [Candidatus Bathyarchaeia archaeon]|nr:histidine ammonia-lyase [Candidatus Bathyarchaeia archaeon]
MAEVTIDGSNLTLKTLVSVARTNSTVRIDKRAIERTTRGRAVLEKLLKEDKVIYGVNTGFGALSNFKVATEDLRQLQANLLRSHAASVGKPHSTEVVRAMMLLRANTLIKGNSGIRPEIPVLIVALLNKRVHPYIPQKGSVGASGDLSPLSHMALVLMGEGKAEYRERWRSGGEALQRAGQDPIQLEAKEGLALNNGTQQTTSIGCLNLWDSYDLLASAEAALALSLEAIRGWIDPFDERIHKIRRHPGQTRVAADVRALLEGSKSCRTIAKDDPGNGRPQDPYSFRCAAQVMGPVLDAMMFVKSTLEIEMNSATDNPLIFPDDKACLSGGNFHGQPISMALDIMGLGLSTLANISERRISALLDASLNNGLTAFLVGRESKPGLASGLMALQYTATALVAENKILSHPASSDSIPTSNNFEDFVSMGPGAAHKSTDILENCRYVIAIELLTAAQAVHLRQTNSKLGRGTNSVYRAIRNRVRPLTHDRSSHEDIQRVFELIKDGAISDIVRRNTMGSV